jgi:hypothetical protein
MNKEKVGYIMSESLKYKPIQMFVGYRPVISDGLSITQVKIYHGKHYSKLP